MCLVPLKRTWSLVGACRGLIGLFGFGCISARKRENAGNAEVKGYSGFRNQFDFIPSRLDSRKINPTYNNPV